MYFVSLYTIPSENRDAAQARFKQGGGPPPAGVKMIGRWHSAGGGRGVTIFEADDVQAVAAWSQQMERPYHFRHLSGVGRLGVRQAPRLTRIQQQPGTLSVNRGRFDLDE